MSNPLAIPQTVAHHAPLAIGFPRQEYCNGVPFLSAGDLPEPGMNPHLLLWQVDSLPLSHQGSPMHSKETLNKMKTTPRMAEKSYCKCNNWQRINFQNIQAVHVAQQQKNNPIKKQAEDLNISPKKTYRWLKNTRKDAQHHSLLEKCKSKLQWGITSHQPEWPSAKKSTNNKWVWILHCWWAYELIQPL